MASREQIEILRQGVSAWNRWCDENFEVRLDLEDAQLAGLDLSEACLNGANLRGADLRGTNLRGAYLEVANLTGADLTGSDLGGATLDRARFDEATLRGASLVGARIVNVRFWKADLHGANLHRTFVSDYLVKANLDEANLGEADLNGANLRDATLRKADLREANLREANLYGADVHGADLRGADLSRADLYRSDLSETKLGDACLFAASLRDTDLRGADLSDADLQEAALVQTKLSGAVLRGCNVYGISAWDVDLEGVRDQTNLRITPEDRPAITVDDLEVAQFIYLLLDNEKIRRVIDTITSKVVLILGRFSDERKPLLDALRTELRRLDRTPLLFDFGKPASKDLMGTVETLARMARFVIADVSDPASVPAELATMIPFLRTTAVLPLRQAGSRGYRLFDDLKAYPWVLDTFEYSDGEGLLASLPQVIAPAEAMAERLQGQARL